VDTPEAQRMSFWSSDSESSEPGAEELAAWLRNVEGSPFGGYGAEPGGVDGAISYYRAGDGTATFDPTDVFEAGTSPTAGLDPAGEGAG